MSRRRTSGGKNGLDIAFYGNPQSGGVKWVPFARIPGLSPAEGTPRVDQGRLRPFDPICRVSGGGPCWLVLVERGVRRAPCGGRPPEGGRAPAGRSERGGDPGCALRRRSNDRLRFSEVLNSVAFLTDGSAILLRQDESEGAPPLRGHA